MAWVRLVITLLLAERAFPRKGTRIVSQLAGVADYWGMRQRVEFRDVLDEKLAGVRACWQPTPPSRPVTASAAAMPTSSLLFASGTGFLGADAGPVARSAYGVHAAPIQASRHSRRLSAADERAVDALRGFGAPGLDEDFSDADVKRAYRVLARRFHPDVHPEATDAERAYLAHAFGRITAAYQQLTRASVS